jgi:hypothetical protein|tara:strand:+ start:2684 stop:2971 length:288 start_codon:yes stop_codon:yes gene_type:complete
MIYLKWKLSGGASGTGPEETIADRGGLADASWAVDAAGYRIGYLPQTANLTGLDTWDVTEQTEAQALTFCAALYAPAAVLPDGTISGPPPPDDDL